MLDQALVRLAPIAADDLTDVGEFLHAHLNPRLSAQAWTDAIVPTWPGDAPNHGFLLRDGGEGDSVVGVQLAFYSTRTIAGVEEQFCNVGAWCVREDHRSQGLRLLRAVLRQRGYHFTDLSPSGNVVELNARLRFERLDTRTYLVPHRPFPSLGRAHVVSDPAQIDVLLDADQRTIFRDHQGAAAAVHLLLVEGAERCYVIVRRDRRKGVPVFASVLYASDPALLRRRLSLLGRHLLAHHRLLATLVEHRHLDARPSGSIELTHPRPKMFRSDRLPAEAIDDLYSELTLVSW